MRKINPCIAILLVLTAMLACLPLSGCEQAGPLEILVDLDNVVGINGQITSMSLADSVRTLLEDHGGPTDVEFTVIPRDGEERTGALTRLRTEIMAGKGPDVFLTAFAWGSEGNTSAFLQPEKSMELGLFLPLDPYIQQAQYMEWDQLTPAIMAAGHSERWGQCLLPLAYSLPLTVFDPAEVSHAPTTERTWSEQAADPQLRAAAVSQRFLMTVGALGPLADYDDNTLTVTEEELYQVAETYGRVFVETRDTQIAQTPRYVESQLATNLRHDLRIPASDGSVLYDEMGEHGALTWVPMYGAQGGVTATVTAFGAINANTRRPKDAFLVLDLLLSKESQQRSLLSQYLGNGTGVPVYEGLMAQDEPVLVDPFTLWRMDAGDYAQFLDLRSCITRAVVPGTLEYEVMMLLMDSVALANGADIGMTLEEDVASTYQRMRQEVSE